MISGIIDGSERIEMINKELLLALGEQASLCAADGVDRLGPRRFSLDLTNLVYITNEGLSALWQTLSESRRRGIGIDCVEVAGEGMQQILERAGFRTFGHIGMKKPKSEIPTPNEIRTHACGNPNTRVWKSQLPTSRQACFETQKVTETSPRSVGGLDLGQTRPGVGSSSAHRLVVTESVVEEDMVRRYEDKFFSLLRDIESNQSADKEIIIDLKSCHYVDKSFFVALKRFHTACGTRADVTIECPDYLELWLHKYQIPRARVPHACVPGKRAVTQTRLSTNAGSNSL